jgi:histidinol phosphatase-like enzyme (inositol monophosphatase family)
VRVSEEAIHVFEQVPNNKAMSFEKELEFARNMARKAGHLALEFQRHGVSAENKEDDSPVTAADRACEKLLVEAIDVEFPNDGILGEEGANKFGKSSRRWIVDPIDGTRDYVRGIPFWSVLIGLEQDGEIVTGAAYCPGQNLMCSAAKGAGTTANEEKVSVSCVDDFSRAVICFNGFHKPHVAAMGQRLLDWVGKAWAVRGMGGAFDAMLVAMGRADIWIEPSAKPWDFAALKIIVEEAGGLFSDFRGENTIYGGSGIACVPGLQRATRELIG